MEKQFIYIVIHHDFDGIWYNDKVIAVYRKKDDAEQFVNESTLDLSIDEHELIG